MDSLPSPVVSPTGSSRGSPSTPVNQLGRKRARSSPSSDASSSKRAMSEDPSSFVTTEPSLPVESRNVGSEEDIDAYMREQDDSLDDGAKPLSPTSPRSTKQLSPMEKYDLIKSLKSKPMSVGEVWYIVSRSWYRRWERACCGERSKDGILLENQVGPVDNSMFFNEEGHWDRSKQLVEGIDVEFVPQRAWDLLCQWYANQCLPGL